MNPKSRKALSWSISFLIHAALIIFLVYKGIEYALPEGQVTTDATTIDVVEKGPKGEQVDIKTSEPSDKNVPALPKRKSAPVAAMKTKNKVPAVKEPEPKFEPYQENNGIKPVDKDETDTTEPEKPAVKEPPKKEVAKSLPEKTAETKTTESETQNTEDVATQVPANQQQEAPNENAKSEQAAAQNAAGQPAEAQSGDGAPPAYGTPGSMVDESQLVEVSGNEKPKYPWLARLRRQEGTVVLRAFIRKDGRVDLPILEKSSGSPLLDRECIRAYSQWRYKPGISGWVLKPFKFSLTK